MVVLTRSTVVGASLAVVPSVAWRAGAGVAPRAGAAGATIETGPRVTWCYLLAAGGPWRKWGGLRKGALLFFSLSSLSLPFPFLICIPVLPSNLFSFLATSRISLASPAAHVQFSLVATKKTQSPWTHVSTGLALDSEGVSPGCMWVREHLTCVACGAGAVVARGLGVAGPPVGTRCGDTASQLCLTLWSCPTHVTHT